MPLGSFRINSFAAGVVPRTASTFSQSSLSTTTGKFSTGLTTPSGAGNGLITLPTNINHPYTIEFFIKVGGGDPTAVLNISNNIYLTWYGNYSDGFRIWSSAPSLLLGLGTTTITQNAWNHFVFQRLESTNTWRVWTNGTRRGTFSYNLSDISTLRFGKNIETGSFGSDFITAVGFDEIRISKIARYDDASNLTVPTSAFTNDQNTVALFHCESTSMTDDIA